MTNFRFDSTITETFQLQGRGEQCVGSNAGGMGVSAEGKLVKDRVLEGVE